MSHTRSTREQALLLAQRHPAPGFSVYTYIDDRHYGIVQVGTWKLPLHAEVFAREHAMPGWTVGRASGVERMTRENYLLTYGRKS